MWIRSASSATLFVLRKTPIWIRVVARRTTRLIETALTPHGNG